MQSNLTKNLEVPRAARDKPRAIRSKPGTYKIKIKRDLEVIEALMSNDTILYYDIHASEFVAGTVDADMQECRQRFLRYMHPGQKILDAGCGSGRDVISFREAGFDVDAFDASAELCRIATELTGVNVKHLRFEDLEGEAQYDGIWACASLLHVDKKKLPEVLKRLYRLLKDKGVLYGSFKYGSGERVKNGRYFINLTETEFRTLLTEAGFTVKELFVTQDVRNGREDEKWINAIAMKTGNDSVS